MRYRNLLIHVLPTIIMALLCSVCVAEDFPQEFSPGWHLITLPCEPPVSQTPDEVFDSQFGDVYGIIDGDYVHVSDMSELEDGMGFWAHFESTTTVILSGNPIATENLETTLNTGWNMIGSPFDSSDWSAAKVDGTLTGSSGLLESDLYTYDAGLEKYVKATVMSPWKGYFIKAGETSAVTLLLDNGGEVLLPGWIAGTVTLQGETDHSGVSVSVVGQGINTTTNAAGEYVLDSVPPGLRTVQASKLGYATGSVDVTVVTDDTATASGITLLVNDETAPVIVYTAPSSGAEVTEAKPAITATFTDPEPGSGVDASSALVTVQGEDVTDFTGMTLSAAGFTYMPPTPLADGAVEVIASVSDLDANRATQTLSFTVNTESDPDKPGNLITKECQIGKKTKLCLEWDPPSEPVMPVTGYNVYVEHLPEQSQEKQELSIPYNGKFKIDNTSYHVGRLIPGYRYSVQVTAKSEDANGLLLDESSLSANLDKNTAANTGNAAVIAFRTTTSKNNTQDEGVPRSLSRIIPANRLVGREVSTDGGDTDAGYTFLPFATATLYDTYGLEVMSIKTDEYGWGEFATVPQGLYELVAYDEGDPLDEEDDLSITIPVAVTEGMFLDLRDLILTLGKQPSNYPCVTAGLDGNVYLFDFSTSNDVPNKIKVFDSSLNYENDIELTEKYIYDDIVVDNAGNIYLSAFDCIKMIPAGQTEATCVYSSVPWNMAIKDNSIYYNDYDYDEEYGEYDYLEVFSTSGVYEGEWRGLDGGYFYFILDIDVDQEGNIYLLGYLGDENEEPWRVQKITSQMTRDVTWPVPKTARKMTVFDGDLYILHIDEYRDANIVEVYDSAGVLQHSFGTRGGEPGYISSPMDIDAYTSGNIYIADNFGIRGVQWFDSQGNYQGHWSAGDPSNSQLDFTHSLDIAVDDNGYIYILDHMRVWKFSPEYSLIKQWGRDGCGRQESPDFWPSKIIVNNEGNVVVTTASGLYMYDTEGIPIDAFEGDLSSYNVTGIAQSIDGAYYVTNLYPNYFSKYSLSGGYLDQWGGKGFGEGEFYRVDGIAIDSEGSVYVVDNGNHRLQKFTPDGVPVWARGSEVQEKEVFEFTSDMVVSDESEIFVLDSRLNRIQKFASDGQHLYMWGSVGEGDTQFDTPTGITIDDYGIIYVADTGNSRIVKFDTEGNYEGDFYAGLSGDYWYKNKLAVDYNDGSVYVANFNAVIKYASDGTWLNQWSGEGESVIGDNTAHPVDVAVDSNGDILVVCNNYILHFTPELELIGQKWEFYPPYEYDPIAKSIAVSPGGTVYVSEGPYAGGSFILAYDSDGELIDEMESNFTWSNTIRTDFDDNIYEINNIFGYTNYSIVKYDVSYSTSTPVFEIGIPVSRSGQGQLNFPVDVVVNNDDYILVTEGHNNRVQIFDKDGNYVNHWGIEGDGSLNFKGPSGIGIGPDGRVYVADDYSRVRSYSPEFIDALINMQ